MKIAHPYALLALCMAVALVLLAAPYVAGWLADHPPRSAASLCAWCVLLVALCAVLGWWAAVAVGFNARMGSLVSASLAAWLVAKILMNGKPWKHFQKHTAR